MAYERIEELHLESYVDLLEPRPIDSHKKLFGHVLVVGGDFGFSGAVRMAAEAALRVGAGLVSVATRPQHAFMITSMRPEIMCHGVNSAKDLKPLIAKATVIIVGPGLGQGRWSKSLVTAVFKSKKPLIVDADALNLLSAHHEKHLNWILTPHPGEAARLLDITTDEVQRNRLSAVKMLQKTYGGVAVLKGAGTLIAAPNAIPAICTKGNPGMATAGMGDVLSGVLGGLVAQHISLAKAAKLGVLLHALAGDRAAEEGERGMIATDLLPYLRYMVNP
jgi:NAD(P)H-hydrate epimerase